VGVENREWSPFWGLRQAEDRPPHPLQQGLMSTTAQPLSTDVLEVTYLTVVAGALAVIPVAIAINVLRRQDAYSTATATAAKVIIGTVATAWVLKKIGH